MKVQLYVQLRPIRIQRGFRAGEVREVRVAKVTKTRPDETLPDCRLVVVELEVPADNFEVQAVPVEVPAPSQIRAVGR